MKSVMNYLLFVLAIVALFGFSFSFGQSEEAPGKKVFVGSKCQMCHSVKSENLESKKKDAVDLSSVGNTYKSDFFVNYLTKKEKIKDSEHKVAFKGDEANLKALAQWLETLKAEEKK